MCFKCCERENALGIESKFFLGSRESLFDFFEVQVQEAASSRIEIERETGLRD